MIRIPVYLAVAQWGLLLALGLLVFIMYRQLGHVFGNNKPATGHGPTVGSKAAAIEYARLSDDTPGYLTPGDGRPALVVFAEPSCLSCDRLVAAMSSMHDAGELAGLRVLLLMSDPPKYLQISAAFQATRLEIGRVTTRATVDAYKAVATPLLVAIDGSAMVRAAGPAVEVDDVRAFVRACQQPRPEEMLAAVPGQPEGGTGPKTPSVR